MRRIKFALTIAALGLFRDASAADTNTLALYLGGTNVTQYAIQTGHIRPENLKLAPQPIFSADDFASYDPATLSFKVKTEAVKRLVKVWPHRGGFEVQEGTLFLNGVDRPFLLCANGKPVYSGMFTGGMDASILSCIALPPKTHPYPRIRPEQVIIQLAETNAAGFSIEAPVNPIEEQSDPRKSKAVINAAKKLGIIAK